MPAVADRFEVVHAPEKRSKVARRENRPKIELGSQFHLRVERDVIQLSIAAVPLCARSWSRKEWCTVDCRNPLRVCDLGCTPHEHEKVPPQIRPELEHAQVHPPTQVATIDPSKLE